MNERLKEIRKHYNLTMADFGKSLKLVASTVSDMEHGKSAITERTLTVLAAVYPDINIDWLKTGNGTMLKESNEEINRIVKENNFPAVVGQFMNEFNHLNEKDQKIIFDFALSIIKSFQTQTEAQKAETDEEIERKVEAYRNELLAGK